MEDLSQIEVYEHSYLVRLGTIMLTEIVFHPMQYTKVLMQLGYEPILPRKGISFWGETILIYPNIFKYMAFIKKTDGFIGCFRGLCPKLISTFLSVDIPTEIYDLIKYEFFERTPHSITNTSTATQPANNDYNAMKKSLSRDIYIALINCIITHPFYVICIRMMAQFVGKENDYSSLLDSIAKIYHDDGIYGFYSGFIPRLFYEITFTVLSSITIYIANKYVIPQDKEMLKKIFSMLSRSFIGGILYPWIVVSVCMTVSGTDLAAGRPPFMPIYLNWYDCFMHLRRKNELRRGSSLIMRYRPFIEISKVFYIKEE